MIIKKNYSFEKGLLSDLNPLVKTSTFCDSFLTCISVDDEGSEQWITC